MKSVYSLLLNSEQEPRHPCEGRLMPDDEAWSENANCFGILTVFQFETGSICTDPGDYGQAEGHICRDCPVKVKCLEYALENNCKGLWGGTDDIQRRKIKRQRAFALAVEAIAQKEHVQE